MDMLDAVVISHHDVEIYLDGPKKLNAPEGSFRPDFVRSLHTYMTLSLYHYRWLFACLVLLVFLIFMIISSTEST